MVGGTERRGRIKIRRGTGAGAAQCIFCFDVVVEIGRLVGIDVPFAGARDDRHQRRCAERMVERAGKAVEHIGIAVVDDRCQPACAQHVDRIFLLVSVEVTHRNHPWRGWRERVDERYEYGRLKLSGVVEFALPIALIGVESAATRILGLEMVDDGDEDFVVGKEAKRLRNRRARVVERSITRRSWQTDRRHRSGAVNEGRLDRVGAAGEGAPADRIGDESPRTGSCHRVQSVDQILHSRIGTGAVVFNFEQANHIGGKPQQGSNHLGALAIEFKQAIGTA